MESDNLQIGSVLLLSYMYEIESFDNVEPILYYR